MTRDELIAALEQAEVGSRELDCDICDLDSRFEVLNRHPFAGYGKGPFARNVHNNCRFEVAHYSTSLDAALPGENIIESRYLTGHRVSQANSWWARHEAENGSIHHGYGKTEPLARRIAALKAQR